MPRGIPLEKKGVNQVRKRLAKLRGKGDVKPSHLLLSLAMICLFSLLSYISQSNSLFSLSSRTERSLWTAWPLGTPVYELTHRSINGMGKSHVSPVGVMRVIVEANQITQQLVMKVKTAARETLMQSELRLRVDEYDSIGALEKTPSILQVIAKVGHYSLTWRELTQEKSGWWRPISVQLNRGGGKVYAHHDQVNGQTLPIKWCTQWVKAQSTLLKVNDPLKSPPISKSKAKNNQINGPCSEQLLLPRGVWLWLLSVQTRQDSFRLFHEKTGVLTDHITLIHSKSEQLINNKTNVETITRLWQQTSPLSSEVEVGHQLNFSKQNLSKWRELREGRVVWEAQRRPWSGMNFLVDQSSWDTLKWVLIKGLQEWSTARWVSVDLTAPLKPLSSPHRVISDNPSSAAYRYHLLLKRNTVDALKAIPPIAYQEPQAHVDHTSAINLVLSEVLQEAKQSDQSSLSSPQRGDSKPSLQSIIYATLSWIEHNLTYELSGGAPSVEVTLQRGSGDCNELSQVFVEVMNALGVESQMVFGIRQQRGEQWTYHSWVRVSLNHQWIEIDPTVGKTTLSPGYIAFAQGGIEEQSKLQVLIGQTYGRVLDWSMAR